MTHAAVTAFCPGHISGYFRRVSGDTPAATGSLGAGVVISEGVTATVAESARTSVRILRRDSSGRESEPEHGSPPVEYVMERLGVTAAVVTVCRLPIGAGFGLSAAALLATLTALNRLYHLDLSAHDIALIAHEAEVRFRTGLGDVSACQGGGWVVRHGAGIDGRIERRYYPSGPLCAVSFGPIHTPSVLGSPEKMARVFGAFPRRSPRGVGDFFRISQQFSLDSGLATPGVRRVLEACNRHGVPASMTMLGDGVFAFGRDAERILRQFGAVSVFSMASGGARITAVRA